MEDTETHPPAHMCIIHWPGLLCVCVKCQRCQGKTKQSLDRKGKSEEKETVPKNGVNGKQKDQKNGSGCPELCLRFPPPLALCFSFCFLFSLRR